MYGDRMRKGAVALKNSKRLLVIAIGCGVAAGVSDLHSAYLCPLLARSDAPQLSVIARSPPSAVPKIEWSRLRSQHF